MAALVVTVSLANDTGARGRRIGIFPGGATTTLYPAETAFWVGYGFTADRGSETELDDGTRFELDVDGQPASMVVEVRSDAGIPLQKTNVAEFPAGLPAGWHDFTGRWYDGGRLILSTRTTIQFVER